MDTIIGLGGSGHEWSTTAISGSNIVAIAEERLCRRKYGLGADLLAAESRKVCLGSLGKTRDDISHVVACSLVPKTFYHGVRDKATIINHHLAHAYCTFVASGLEESAIMVVDNAGSIIEGNKAGNERSVETISLFKADKSGIELLKRTQGAHRLQVEKESDYYAAGETSNSIGHFYRTASLTLGFYYRDKNGSDLFSEDGKTMGLAPYGDTRFVDRIGALISLDKEGEVTIPLDGLENTLRECFGNGTFDERAALAYAVQYHTELALLHCARYLLKNTGSKNLCIAGGVGLNSVANGRLQMESGFWNVFVAPAPSDDGISLGCAYYGLHKLAGHAITDLPSLETAYLGPPPDYDGLEETLASLGLAWRAPADLASVVASALAEGCFIGLFEGRSEFGPRALCNRSILAAPFPAWTRDKLNHEIKRREWFRPYGVVVPEDKVAVYFDYSGVSPFMSFVARVKDPGLLPAATHVDGTVRFQTIREKQNPLFYDILKAFEIKTGVAIIINTSFNAAGEPMVETPVEAIKSARDMNLDMLVIEDKLILLSHKAVRLA